MLHAHWTKGNLIRSTGEIDPESEFALLQTTLKFSSRLETQAKARIASPSPGISVSLKQRLGPNWLL